MPTGGSLRTAFILLGLGACSASQVSGRGDARIDPSEAEHPGFQEDGATSSREKDGAGEEAIEQRRLGYAIVVSEATRSDPGWSGVVAAAVEKHAALGARVFAYASHPDETRGALASFGPRYVAFITRPDETTPQLTQAAHDLAAAIDPDPYVDAVWGIITGFTPADARDQVAPAPIRMTSGLTRTGSGWLKYFQRGLYLTEDAANPGQWGSKEPGAPPVFMSGGPTDDTARFVGEVNSNGYQFIMGSGHGNHDIWQLMYPTGTRFVRSYRDGTLSANDASGNDYPITTTNPKVYWAVGNCLTGFIHGSNGVASVDYHDSFALAWMRRGVKNYLGATHETAYATFWFQPNYMHALQDRWTYAEGVFLLRQEIHYELTHGLSAAGDEYTEGIMVLYGDPALDARLARELPPALDESIQVEPLAGSQVRVRYQVRVVAPPARLKRGEVGWRVHATLLPLLLSNVQVESSTFADVEVTGETLVWNSGAPLGIGEMRSVTFAAQR